MLLYADHNLPGPCTVELRHQGHNVLTAFQDDRHEASDIAILTRACELGRILLTLNRKHFRRHCIEGIAHVGIASAGHDSDFISLALRFHKALEGRAPGRWHIFIDKGGVRDEEDVLRERQERPRT
jgi:hypothetical protein